MWNLDTKEVYRVSPLFSVAFWSPTAFILTHWTSLRWECWTRNACWNLLLEMSAVSFLLVLQRFTGHSTAVTTLCFATTRPPDSNGLYFLSGAAHDRLLSVWWAPHIPKNVRCRVSRRDSNITFVLSVAGKCGRMAKTRIQWFPSRWRTRRDTSTSSRPAAKKRSEVLRVWLLNQITSRCFCFFYPIVRSAWNVIVQTFSILLFDCVLLVLCTGNQAGGSVQGWAAASLRALFKRVRSCRSDLNLAGFWLSFVNGFLCSPPWWPPGSTALLSWCLVGWWQLHFLAVRNSKGHYLKCVASASATRPCKKPLSPSCTVQLADTRDSPAPIPLLAAALGADARSVMLAYGSHLQPAMERAVSVGDAPCVMFSQKEAVGWFERLCSVGWAAHRKQNAQLKKKSCFMFRWCRHFVFHFADPKYLFLTGCFLHTIHSGN